MLWLVGAGLAGGLVAAAADLVDLITIARAAARCGCWRSGQAATSFCSIDRFCRRMGHRARPSLPQLLRAR